MQVGVMGKCQKVPKFDFKSRFSRSKIKNHPNLSYFFFIEEYELRSTFFVIGFFFLMTPILKSLHFLKWCPSFDSSLLLQSLKLNYFLWVHMLIFSKKTFLILYPSLENTTTGIAIQVDIASRGPSLYYVRT